MVVTHCPSCQRNTGFKRCACFPTVLAWFITGGVWILVWWLFYPLRCTICGHGVGETTQGKKLLLVASILLLIYCLSHLIR